MKAIGYVRVSTDGQATDGVSIETQAARIQAWADANGYELTAVHADAGMSGCRADNRPGLQAALAQASSGAALVVYSLSRLARSTKDAIAISERLGKQGADLVSLSERIDTTTAAGKMIFRMMAVLAEFERDQISERTAAALAHKRSKGERVGTVPYGFSVAEDGASLVPNAEEQAVITAVSSMRHSGMSLRAIRDRLEAERIPNRKGNVRWRLNTISAILQRRAA